MPNATMTVVKTATSQQVYSGEVTAGTIPTGAGSIKVTITQFGSTIEKDLQVAGETVLDLSNDVAKVAPATDAVSWTFKNISMPLSPISVIKGANGTVRTVFGNWDSSHEMYAQGDFTFNADTTIQHDYSNVFEIEESGTFIAPVARQYEIVAIGGGGGGGGGARSYIASNKFGYAGGGGSGGNSGTIKAWRETLAKNQTVSVTIGQGGTGGQGGSSGNYGGSGSTGGSTIFGSTSVSGGNGGSGGAIPTSSYSRTAGDGGNGGNGGNGRDSDIFGESKGYGRGGSGGTGARSSSNVSADGQKGNDGGNRTISILLRKYSEDPYVDFGAGGGDGGDGGNLSSTGSIYGGQGGDGGEGLLMRIDNVTTYGHGYGGNGGQGGSIVSGNVRNGATGITGEDGCIILRAVL